jgi:excisionase family DNA binding protein
MSKIKLESAPVTQTESTWCDIKAAAAHLGMSVAFLRKAVRQRRVPFARVGSKALRFRKADLDAWLQRSPCPADVRR